MLMLTSWNNLQCSAPAPVHSLGNCLAAKEFTHLLAKEEIHLQKS